MKKQIAISLGAALLAFIVAPPLEVRAQGIGEFTGLQALGIGLGAGFAAADRGKLSKFAHNSTVQVQQSLAVQTRAIEQYYAMGNKLEANKQWENAEKYFVCCLQMIARRDGPGSVKSVPTLRHLATVNASQNKLDQATSYEKTVLAFTKAGKHPDKEGVLKESVGLSKLLVKSAKYSAAEPILKDSIEVANAGKIKTPDYRNAMRMYGLVLKELKKPEEAAKVEAQLAAEATVGTTSNAPVEASATPSAQSNFATTAHFIPSPAAQGNAATFTSATASASQTSAATFANITPSSGPQSSASTTADVSQESTRAKTPQPESPPVTAVTPESLTAPVPAASTQPTGTEPAAQTSSPVGLDSNAAPQTSAQTGGNSQASADRTPGATEPSGTAATTAKPPADTAPATPTGTTSTNLLPVNVSANSASPANISPADTTPASSPAPTIDESTK